jgi:hypothetical protein
MENLHQNQEQENPLVKALAIAFPGTQFKLEGDNLKFTKKELDGVEIKNIATLADVYKMEAFIGRSGEKLTVRFTAADESEVKNEL